MDQTEERDIYSTEDWTDEEAQAYLAAAGKNYIDSIHIERSTVSHWGLTGDGYSKVPVSKRCVVLIGFHYNISQIKVSNPTVKQAVKQVLVMLERRIEQAEDILRKKGKLPPRESEDVKDGSREREEAASDPGEDSRGTGLTGDGGLHEERAQSGTPEASLGEGVPGGEERGGSDDDPSGRDVHPGEGN